MSCYLIKVRYTETMRGSEELRNRGHYPYTNCDAVSDILQDAIEYIFKARCYNENFFTDDDSQVCLIYRGLIFDDEAVAAFKAEIEEAFGPAIWDEIQPFTVSGELKSSLYVDADYPELTALQLAGLKYEPSESERSEFWKSHGKDECPPWEIDG
jgi:hypothetical protein